MQSRPIALVFALALSSLVLAGQAGKQVSPEQAKLDRLKKGYVAAKAKYTKQPKNTNLKKNYIEATVAYGNAMMTSPVLSAKQKYPGALRLYREALKLDPKHKVALANKKTIEDIYKSMGREIPK